MPQIIGNGLVGGGVVGGAGGGVVSGGGVGGGGVGGSTPTLPYANIPGLVGMLPGLQTTGGLPPMVMTPNGPAYIMSVSPLPPELHQQYQQQQRLQNPFQSPQPSPLQPQLLQLQGSQLQPLQLPSSQLQLPQVQPPSYPSQAGSWSLQPVFPGALPILGQQGGMYPKLSQGQNPSRDMSQEEQDHLLAVRLQQEFDQELSRGRGNNRPSYPESDGEMARRLQEKEERRIRYQ
eukprot:TRINITY_DN4686_c0_g1_i12.p1 TRINITY_DN4686_c0_g1~~TRINITY_DN4686_c0_g1_i12.p1  ORF type:complete len:233 (+),score=64.50 TRINITY_DN4686_c0_g1_i12:472-1170(+)